jgi:uncharacterized SAM-binding protein YcdF (DUF218 family)
MIRRLISAIALIWMLGFITFILALPKAADDTRTQGVIVLTGGQGRVQRGLEVMASRHADRLLISGVDRDVTLNMLANTYHVPADLVACCIDIGHTASDTRSNAVEAAKWIKLKNYHSVRIVTNNWHMPRALLELEQAVPANVVMTPDAVEVPPTIGILFQEYNKYLWRWLSLFGGKHLW